MTRKQRRTAALKAAQERLDEMRVAKPDHERIHATTKHLHCGTNLGDLLMVALGCPTKN